jgi:hypothetical protein
VKRSVIEIYFLELTQENKKLSEKDWISDESRRVKPFASIKNKIALLTIAMNTRKIRK